MGGRATQEITYSEKSVSELKSMQIEISVAAQASFLSYFGSGSGEGSTDSTTSNYAKSTSESIRQFYVGGALLSGETLATWQSKVK